MKFTTKQILNTLHVLSWIIFVGVCVEAGGFIVSCVATLLLDPAGAQHFWKQVDLSALYYHNSSSFFVVSAYMVIVAVMRAVLFYLIIEVLHDKKLNIVQLFDRKINRFILNMSYLTFLIGLFSFFGVNYIENLVKEGVQIPDVQYLRLGGADVWLFMAVTLFLIAKIYKRGIEIQEEHELTV